MKNIRGILKDLFLFLTLIIITLIVIFNNNNFRETMTIIANVNYVYVLLGIIIMSFYFIFESLNIKNILRRLGSKMSVWHGFKYSLIGFFFSGITPAATGGQPMQIYYMKKGNISVTHSTLALLMQVCSFHIMTIICGIVGLILNHKLLDKNFICLFLFGLFFKGLALIVMLIGLFSQKLSKKIVNVFVRFLQKIKFKNIENMKENIDNSLKEYGEGSIFIRNNKKIFLQSLFFALLEVISYYMVPYFVYCSFGLNKYGIVDIILIQAMLYVMVSSIPLPGAVGVSEAAFLHVYLTIFGVERLASATLLSRGINFYLFVLFGFILTVYTIIKIKKAHL